MTPYDIWKTTPPSEPQMPRCPWCHAETSEVYVDAAGEVCGCEKCIEAEDAEGRICQICAAGATEYYYRDGELIGCDRCVREVDAESTQQTRGGLLLRGSESWDAYIALIKAGVKVRLEDDDDERRYRCR